jgi:Na+/H+-dicarboxylate symporter
LQEIDRRAYSRPMSLPLSARMLLGLGLGAGAGLLVHGLLPGDPAVAWSVKNVARPIGQVFLRLLFVLVIPLLVSGLALGVAGLGDLRRLGRVGLKTFAATVVVSGIAVLIGIGAVHLFRPGEGVPPEVRARLLEGAAERASGVTASTTTAKSGVDFLVQIVPDNPIRAMANGDFLAVMFFALLLGIGLSLTNSDPARRLEEALQGLYEVTMKLIDLVIQFAPIGVAALLFALTADVGPAVLGSLGRYVFVVVLALAVHQFVVYPIVVSVGGGMDPRRFFRGAQEAMITAFSTASSNATLPTSLRVAEEKLRLPPEISRFVLTIGSTANQNGTALFEGVTVLFLAQFYGVPLDFGQQLLVVGVCILGGVGTAGVPAGSIPVVAMILGLIGVPVDGIGIILGVDRFLDMCRTTLNVTGDLAIATVVARGEPHAVA